MVAAGGSPRLSDSPIKTQPDRPSKSNEPFNERPGGRYVLRHERGQLVQRGLLTLKIGQSRFHRDKLRFKT